MSHTRDCQSSTSQVQLAIEKRLNRSLTFQPVECEMDNEIKSGVKKKQQGDVAGRSGLLRMSTVRTRMYTAASTGQWQQFASISLVNRKMVILKGKTERNRCYGYIWLSLDPIYICVSSATPNYLQRSIAQNCCNEGL